MSASDAGSHSNEAQIALILENMDKYIRDLAYRNVPRNIVPEAMLDLATADLAQDVRIKLWQALQRENITNLKAYIRRIVHTQAVDIVRKYKHFCALPPGEYRDLQQHTIMITPGEEMKDPAVVFEELEAVNNRAVAILDQVLALPQHQRQPVLYLFYDQAVDMLPLMRVFLDRGLEITDVASPPQDKNVLNSYRSSLSIARKKLRNKKCGQD